MKKLNYIFTAIVTSALMFAAIACSNSSDDESGGGSNTNLSSNISEPIFDSNDTTESVMSFLGITYEDGDWIYQEIQTGSGWKSANYGELTISENGSKITFTKYCQWDNKNGEKNITALMKNYEDAFSVSLKYMFNKTNSTKTKFYRHDKESDDEEKGPYIIDTYLMKK